jgi:ABC-type Fe3+/spermidine/putrescine transport system ATPase subunit
MALEVRGLTKRRGGFSLSLDLRIEEGETLVLAGPSGCGKTTALSLIAGLLEADSGSVIAGGKPLDGLPPWKRNIGFVFQDLALFPHLSVGGNVAYGLLLRGVPARERRRAVAEALSLARLAGFERRGIGTLSGGERQRAAIARAIASRPRALLLDEPFSSLDAPLRRELLSDFRALVSRLSCPCVFVTHDKAEAAALGDRVALMSEGRVIEEGDVRLLTTAPKTAFGKRFFLGGSGGTGAD